LSGRRAALTAVLELTSLGMHLRFSFEHIRIIVALGDTSYTDEIPIEGI